VTSGGSEKQCLKSRVCVWKQDPAFPARKSQDSGDEGVRRSLAGIRLPAAESTKGSAYSKRESNRKVFECFVAHKNDFFSFFAVLGLGPRASAG
jgi:hypothetical protein